MSVSGDGDGDSKTKYSIVRKKTKELHRSALQSVIHEDATNDFIASRNIKSPRDISYQPSKSQKFSPTRMNVRGMYSMHQTEMCKFIIRSLWHVINI